MPTKFAGSSTEGVTDHGRHDSRRILLILYILPVVSATTAPQTKIFKKYVTVLRIGSHFFSENGRGRRRPSRESENFFWLYVNHQWSQLSPRTIFFKKYVTVLRTAIFFRKMGVADHARRESRRIFSDFICTTSGLSYHREQKISKNT